MEVFETLEEGLLMYAERCGGACGGGPVPPPSTPTATPAASATDATTASATDAPATSATDAPAVTTTCGPAATATNAPTAPPAVLLPIIAKAAPDNFVVTHIHDVGEAEAAMLRARAGGADTFRRWYVEPGRRIYMSP
jgi:hypothetical protein